MAQHNKQEQTWRGDFGDAYTDRNQFDQAHIQNCMKAFSQIFAALPSGAPVNNILEIGCNLGRNLEALHEMGKTGLYGIEPNQKARERAQALPFVKPENIKDALGAALPFDDGAMDLVFTSVVLIHVPEDQLAQTLSEIHRVSNRFILAMEYFNPGTQTIPYRGHDDLLFKRDYGSIYLDQFNDLRLIDYGFFWKRVYPSQDNTTWWLFEKQK